MKLLKQILSELGAGETNSFMVAMGYCGYFCNVKRVEELSAEKISLRVGKELVTVEGNDLGIDKYFENDLVILGKIRGVYVE
jgi:hypothetical protein